MSSIEAVASAPASHWSTDPGQLADLSTPCYVFDPAIVLDEYRRLKAALGTPLIVSLKANPNPDLFARCAHAFDDGVELASLGELNVVIGRSTIPKFINTPALDRQLMQAGMASRATLVLDSLGQVDTLTATLDRARPRPVVLRVNAASLIRAHRGQIPRGGMPGSDHFGMDERQLLVAIERLRDSDIGVRGIHVFAGSLTFKAWSAALCAAMLELLPVLEETLGGSVDFVNLGGGFSQDWHRDPQHLQQYRECLQPLQARTSVHHEAGRAIFAQAGAFVTTVTAVKSLNDQNIVVCDGGIAHNFLLAQTESIVKRLRRPQVVPLAAGPRAALPGPIRVVGNSCSRMDVIGEIDSGTPVIPGDRLLFQNCGAYSTYSLVGFLSLKAAQRYLVS
jgi:diaminopimelate decarboxylase